MSIEEIEIKANVKKSVAESLYWHVYALRYAKNATFKKISIPEISCIMVETIDGKNNKKPKKFFI